ncbi:MULTISPECIES: M20 family metallopeptidase [unclassified Paenibacillus]|uniref:M20 family metallopeptidase n=1 Tax=unclassified Paenibacillus TaxID=185978 RepID=UPI001AE8A93F|nr:MULTISPECIES: M20 family metallopeptidase [unclassified Paenibacillus]MBP1154870.1 acetylornithine deacetylase/succinyl-diaminopimelate desuccinylase [Paenibacillus sp. PvP091]MBP1169746.1 acetylornithine deacetylase/succinyl-diaminopimelate desuccinylase [Paenibacillus sp. PvR098]MBP2440774.1 acetylornithine deacetylase/succinyl-diaminopimelate desuccinylase [Paenibacillus sp. PvP052]
MISEDLYQSVLQAVDKDEILELVRTLVMIPSHWANTGREKEIAKKLKEIFDHEGIESYLQEVIDGRENVIASLKGTGGGRSLMLNGHIDTVPPFGMEDPFSAQIQNGVLHGRGSADMKSGVGTMAYALIILNRLGIKLKGDLIFAGVIDEDAASSKGSRHLIQHGPTTDAAIVGEPTLLHPVAAHKGIDYFEVEFKGKSAHSSAPEIGVNAIYAAACFIHTIQNELIPAYSQLNHPLVGAPTINVGLIQGCAQGNKPFLLGESDTFAGTVPDNCKVYIDIRWNPDQTIEQVTEDVRKAAESVKRTMSNIEVNVNYIPMPRPPMEIDSNHDLVQIASKHLRHILGHNQEVKGVNFWADSGLLYGLGGIPTLLLGPGDISYAHSDKESIEISQLVPAVILYVLTALEFCGFEETYE